MTSNEEEMIVTPWKVAGKIDYAKLIREFGTQPLTKDLLERVKKYAGSIHMQLRRALFFSHRDFDWILNRFDHGEKFGLYTGRGPSGPVHLGHLIPWFFTQHLQEVFGAHLYFQMTDDEKFLIHSTATLEGATETAYDNALDVIAVGLDPKKTTIIFDVKDMKMLYPIAVKIAKHITLSTVKAVFGFEDSTNIGLTQFPAIQAAPCFLQSVLEGKNVPCLIPAAIDQDPYWRVTRDVAPKIGFYKPAQIHSRFLPGLGKGGKMSASQPETCIFTTDSPRIAKRKILNAFTGGMPTTDEQKKHGGNPDICTVYQYDYFLFEEDDRKLKETYERCKSGSLLCGEHKQKLAEKIEAFLVDHQKKREKAKDVLDDFLLTPRGATRRPKR